MELLAHYDRTTGEKQMLLDHLFNVATAGREEAKTIKQGNIVYLLGLFHDLGKSDRNFQFKLLENPKLYVNHSSAGAKFIENYILEIISDYPDEQQDKLVELCEILMYVITAHHGIYDIPSKNKNNEKINKLFDRVDYDRVEKKIKYSYDSDVILFAEVIEKELIEIENISFKELIKQSFQEFLNIQAKLSADNEKETAFYRGMLVRLYLSFLKNADIKDTVNAFEEKIKEKDAEKNKSLRQSYLDSVETLYRSFGVAQNEMNRIRTRLADQINLRGKKDSSGIYRLNLPTGSGKTMMTLRYACQQMTSKNKRRFFYTAPFLSILEQNAKAIKKIIGDEGVLEHHSNIFDEEELEGQLHEENEHNEIDEAQKAYLLDSWDSNVVLTTMVQFFQTLFKGKSANIRRFSSLAQSVIILDEVQSLPIEVTTLFNLTMNFLAKAMGTTVVLCTATQPKYDAESIPFELDYGGNKQEEVDLVNLNQMDRQVFERVVVNKMNGNQFSDLEDIETEIHAHPEESILIILNTKKAAENLYMSLSESTNRKCYYLSTNLCPYHRMEIIDQMRSQLNKEPIVCVSTQLIEAGVDLDFNRLIRSYAGIDSLVQAMGRCNREGVMKDKGNVSLVRLPKEVENISMLKGYKNKRDITEQIIYSLDSTLNITELNDQFYEYYYANSHYNDFNYPIEKDMPTGFDLLSLNEDNCQNLDVNYLSQSFATAAKCIDLIANDSHPVIVYYNNNQQLIEDLIEAANNYDFERVAYLQKRLQIYTINIYNLEKYQEAIITDPDGRIWILASSHYDSKLGLKEEASFMQF